MSSPTAESKKIHLKTSDGELFDVEESVAMELQTVKSFFVDIEAASHEDTVVPLPNVSSRPLSKILEYCRKQLGFDASSAPEDDRKKYKEEFVKEQDNEELKELILAANYLNIKDLLDLLNQTVADLIANKSVEYVRAFFGIESDFTPQEEAALRQEYDWAFEGVSDD